MRDRLYSNDLNFDAHWWVESLSFVSLRLSHLSVIVVLTLLLYIYRCQEEFSSLYMDEMGS